MKQKLEQLKSKRSELLARAKTAEAQIKVHDAVKSIDVLDPTSELGRFEDKVRRQEALAAGKQELAASSLDAQFNEPRGRRRAHRGRGAPRRAEGGRRARRRRRSTHRARRTRRSGSQRMGGRRSRTAAASGCSGGRPPDACASRLAVGEDEDMTRFVVVPQWQGAPRPGRCSSSTARRRSPATSPAHPARRSSTCRWRRARRSAPASIDSARCSARGSSSMWRSRPHTEPVMLIGGDCGVAARRRSHTPRTGTRTSPSCGSTRTPTCTRPAPRRPAPSAGWCCGRCSATA